MFPKANETKEMRAQVSDLDRCQFTTRDGRRCASAHMGNASRLCILHEGRCQKVDEAEVRAVSEELMSKTAELQTREDVNRLASQLFTMVAQKRISRQDGSLLAYIASIVLQTIAPAKRTAATLEMDEYVESAAAPIPRERILRERFMEKPVLRDPILRSMNGLDPITGEPIMPGRSYNPYDYPSKRK